MRHDIDRYRMLLRTEQEIRARRVLIDMIAELESRPIVSGLRVPLAKDGPPVVRRRISASPHQHAAE
jgi:hypothetical protein